jgi:hypothetical protein
MDCSFARLVNIFFSGLVTEKLLAEAREGELRASFRSQELDHRFFENFLFISGEGEVAG